VQPECWKAQPPSAGHGKHWARRSSNRKTERLAYPIGLTASNHPFATSGLERGTLEVHGMRANDVVTYAPSVAISVSR
jgi:hypothetical protein